MNESVQEGYILTAYFNDAMAEFEKQPVGMRLYYPDMIDAINVKTEQQRLAKVQFHAPPLPEQHEVLGPTVDQMLRKGEDSIARGQYDQARHIFEDVNRQSGVQPRALYDLAIVATQQRQPEAAKEYFQKTLEVNADPHLKAWSHIYLGRLLDLEGNRDQARAEYTAALNAGDPAAETRSAAEKGLREPFAPANPSPAEKRPEEKTRNGVPLGKD